MKQLRFLFLLFVPVILTCSFKGDKAGDQREELHAIFAKEWTFRLAEHPFFATSCGVRKYNAQIPDVSPEAQKKRAEFWRKILEEVAKIDRNALSRSDQINYDLFRYQLEDAIAQVAFESYLLPFNSEGGFLTDFYYMVKSMPLEEKQDYENLLSRLSGFGRYVDQHVALMQLGMSKKMTQPRVIMQHYDRLLEGIRVAKVEEHPYCEALQRQPHFLSEPEWLELQQRTYDLLQDTVSAALQRFSNFMEEEYLPQCRERIGVSELPNGIAYYQQRAAFFTTTNHTVEEIFTIGQEEVGRIRKRMEAILAEIEFSGSFADFLQFLRTDPQFYAADPKELLMEAAYLAKKMDGKLPDYFNKLPRLPYGVEAVPASIAPNYTTGRYSEGSLENHRSGTYWVNTYNLKSRPLYSLPALTLHEAVPGHHLQISLAQELVDIPPFRKYTYLSCYGEGWGLYAEYLGEEAGMYETPYTRFGRLTYEMWRACRLVIDIGIHVKGWTREQAVDYMAGNTALSLHNVNTEIDRYIGWPGQALSYKMGELKIIELRRKAESALGQRFDLRAFHDVVLEQGAVPLFVLEELVDEFIQENLSD